MYEFLGLLNGKVSEPLMNLSRSVNLPFLAAFLIGLLGSTAPCQLTTNLGAMGYITADGENESKVLKITLWYSIGKMAVFLLYGVLITLFKVELQKISLPIFSTVRKFMGTFVIIIGLYILWVINLKGSIGSTVSNKADNFLMKYPKINSSFKLGALFSLAFCPTLFWLFFGLIVPLSTKSTFGFVLPVIFAIGTLLPMILIILALTSGKRKININMKSIRKLQKYLRIAGGVILIVLGLLDSFIYWFT